MFFFVAGHKFMLNLLVMLLCRKTKSMEDGNKKSHVVTHASVRPTHVPTWEEMLTLNLDEKTAEDESN